MFFLTSISIALARRLTRLRDYRSNVTMVLPDYMEAYGRISELNVHLNIAEKAWAACG